MSRKALAWMMLALLALVAVVPLYLRGAFYSSQSEPHEALPVSEINRQDQQSGSATGVTSAVRAPTHQTIGRTGVLEEFENVNVEPSGAVVGQLIEDENLPLDPEATGILSASMDAESNEHAAETLDAENVNVEPSGVIVGQSIEDENLPLDPVELQAATGTDSQ